jgi:hypothetical protein
MDVLANTPFIQQWRGQIFLTTEQAANTLKPADPELEYNL